MNDANDNVVYWRNNTPRMPPDFDATFCEANRELEREDRSRMSMIAGWCLVLAITLSIGAALGAWL